MMTASVAAALLAAPLGAQEHRTTRQMEALSRSAANRAAQRDLLSVLAPIDRIRSGMFVTLHGVGFSTQPFGTEIAGVCRRDDVTLWYAPTTDGPAPADVPVQPYSIESRPLFHIIRLPDQQARPDRPRPSPLREECSGLSGDDVTWLTATDAFRVVQGASLLDRALKAIKAGTLDPAICADTAAKGERSCAQSIRESGGVAGIGSVATCPAEPGTVCYVMDCNPSTELTIRARGSEDRMLPGAILSIKAEDYIVVT